MLAWNTQTLKSMYHAKTTNKMSLTKQELADLKDLLANTHTTERPGKYDAYKVAAYMRDKGRDVISKIIEKYGNETT